MNMSDFNTRTTSKSLGAVELRFISCNDQQLIERMILDIKDDRDFAIQTLHRQLLRPKLDMETFNDLPDDELGQLASDYSRKELKHALESAPSEAVFPKFRQAVDRKFRKDREEIRVSLNSIRFSFSDQLSQMANALSFNSIERTLNEANRMRQEQIDSTLRSFSQLAMPKLSDIANLAGSSVIADFAKPSAVEEAVKSMAASSLTKDVINSFNASSKLEEMMGISSVSSQLGKAMSGMSEAKLFAEQQNRLSKEILDSISGQYNLTSMALEALKPQIDIYQQWAGIHTEALSGLGKFWKEFEFNYHIHEEKAVKVLKKYNWFVSPSLPAAFVREAVRIGNRKGNQRKAINKLFVDHFRENNYSNLLEMIEGWEDNGLSRHRVRKLKGCVRILRNKIPGVNPCDYVLPVVISQIDGLKTEYLKGQGLSLNKRQQWTDSTGKQVDWKKEFKNHAAGHCMDELAGDILLEVLFQKAYSGMPLKRAITFNRHKILHGESLNYGRIDNTVRAFMLLDFLLSLQ